MKGYKEYIIKDIEKLGEEGDELANWWKVFSRILRKYILPYIEELKEKIDDNYLNEMIEEVDKFYIREGLLLKHRIGYILGGFKWDIFKFLDIFLRATDVEYRSLRAGNKLGEDLWLVESELMVKIYEYDSWYRLWRKSGIYVSLAIPEDQIGYLVFSGGPPITKENIEDVLNPFEEFYKTLIIVGYQDRIDPQLESLLTSYGFRYIRRTVNDNNNNNIVIIFAKIMEERTKTE